MPLKPGSKAPEFSLPSQAGATVALSALAGKKVVLYFYPRDGSPSCTVEACEFRKKLSLPFVLLADCNHAVAKRYGAWGEKSMFKTRYFGIRRTTFLIDEKGYIVTVFQNVRTKGHAARVLEAVR